MADLLSCGQGFVSYGQGLLPFLLLLRYQLET